VSPARVVEAVRQRLGAEPRIGAAHRGVALSFAEGVLTRVGVRSEIEVRA
jgi:hypothetical protein